jgi:hypothetical protein
MRHNVPPKKSGMTRRQAHAFAHTRRAALFFTVVFFFVILILVLYINGKILYDYGLS